MSTATATSSTSTTSVTEQETTVFSGLAERVTCINLLKRPDRYEKSRERLTAVGLPNVEYLQVHRHWKGGRYGCYDSHRQVIQQAYDDGLKNLLVFEDDIKFEEGYEAVVQQVNDFVNSGVEYDAIMLGSSINYFDEPTSIPDIWRVKCLSAHAYVVSRTGMAKFLSASPFFETHIETTTHDILQLSVWQHLYSHMSKSVTQDINLGTDNSYVSELPQRYQEWFITTVYPTYTDYIAKPLIQSLLWRSTFGKHYTLLLDSFGVDDGRVKVTGLWLVEMVMVLLIMCIHNPPFGYKVFLSDMFDNVGTYMSNRMHPPVTSHISCDPARQTRRRSSVATATLY